VRAANYHLTWEWRPVSLYRRDSVQLIQKKKSPASATGPPSRPSPREEATLGDSPL
jgi:hypothetical protein